MQYVNHSLSVVFMHVSVFCASVHSLPVGRGLCVTQANVYSCVRVHRYLEVCTHEWLFVCV